VLSNKTTTTWACARRAPGDLQEPPSQPSLPNPSSNIQVSRVRNGQIVALRDHHNHLVLAEVLGQLPTLLAAPANEDLT
jgi:hypothetical protein